MRISWLVLVASVTPILALAASCAGSMEDPAGNAPVGHHAELVTKKREWLKAYHDDCQVCFRAFEQCKVGASSADEEDACQIALDACVRGGLEGPGEAADGGVGEGAADPADADAGSEADDPAEIDGGLDEGDGNEDGDAGSDEDAEAGGAGDDPGKIDLIEDIGQCLDAVRSCLGAPNAETKSCVGELKICVKTAIEGAFEDLCHRQISACVIERVPEDALQSVRDLCEDELAIAP